MRFLYRLTPASLLLLASLYPAGAQSTAGVGFDPTPVDIPHVAKSAPRPVMGMDLLSIRDVEGVAISPDGKYVAFILGQAVYENNSERSGLFVVGTAPGSTARSLGTAGVPHWDRINQWVEEAPIWSLDSRYITYRTRMRNEDTWQVWRWDLGGGDPIRLTHVTGNVRSYQWSPEGTSLVLNVETLVDPSEREELSRKGILYDGSILAWQQLPLVDEVLATRHLEKQTWIHDLGSGEERKPTEQEQERSGPWVSDLPDPVKDRIGDSSKIEDAKVSPDGRKVAYRYEFEKPGQPQSFGYHLFLKPVRGGTPIDLTPDAYYVGQYWWSPDGGQIYYSMDPGNGHASTLMVAGVTGGAPHSALRSADPVGEFSMDASGRLLACTRENNTTPQQIALADVSSGAVETLVDPNPEFQNIELSPGVRMERTTQYGEAWFGQLVKPLDYQAGKRYPLIITTYRSGDYFQLGASGNENPIQVYAAHGFVVLAFDIEQLRTWRRGDFNDHLLDWASPVAGMEMAIDELSQKGIIDRGRVGIGGYSHGMDIVGYALTHTNLFRAASGGSVYDPYFYYMSGKVWQNQFANWGLGGWPEGKAKQRWEELASSLRADKIHAALLNNESDSEYVVDLSLQTSLEQLGKPVEMFIYPNELHRKNQPMHRLEIYERNLDWFRFWLEGEEDPSPDKVEQYERWRGLRKLQEQNQSNAPAN
jgi:dipeptidyl aminopeptidase/acylaminoacyl peptidase